MLPPSVDRWLSVITAHHWFDVSLGPHPVIQLNSVCVCELDNRLEELQGKYHQEMDERKRLETELKVLQVKVSTTDVPFYHTIRWVFIHILQS